MTLATNGLQNAVAYRFVYADAAARTGATGFVAGDVGALALQQDTNVLYLLTATTPTWQATTGVSAHASTHATGGSDPVSPASIGAAAATHTHAAADVTSGVFAIGRLATGTPDGTKFVRDDGTLAVPAGSGGTGSTFPYVVAPTPPDPTAFAWTNQGVATLDTSFAAALHIACPPQSGNNLHLYGRAATAGSFSVTAALYVGGGGIAGDRAGLYLRNSTSGTIITASVYPPAAGQDSQLAIEKWNSTTSYNGSAASRGILGIPLWFRLREAASVRYYECSYDGGHWLTLYSEATGTFLTPNQVGIFVSNDTAGGATLGTTVSLLSWVQV